MSHAPKDPTSPGPQPRAATKDAVALPERPAGFVGFCDWCDRMPDAVRPKGKPRRWFHLGAVEWSWGRFNERFDDYYLQQRRRHWLLWIRTADEDQAQPSQWTLFGWTRYRFGSLEEAAVHLLMAAWAADEAARKPGRFHFVTDDGELSAEQLHAMADRVWGEEEDPRS